jgi:hypothetical protein
MVSKRRLSAVKIQLRLPKARHRELKATAKHSKTSMHAEILRRLAYDEAALNRDFEWVLLVRTVQQIWDMLRKADTDGIQASQGRAPAQNGSAAQERPPQSRDG